MLNTKLLTEAEAQGLTPSELELIIKAIGREPNRVELGIFAVMWSEHCCYKSSKIYLKQFPTQGERVLQGPGENAGLIDIGEDDVLAFKIESHNHPSFIEPYQGAATGVGGILRDIFTMGARPIAVLDALFFGEPAHEKTSFLFHGVVGGIAGYGNCMGIPTVGGEIHFDAAYNGNNLVNAMAIGLGKKQDIHKGFAKGAGNVVLYLGSATGRDGIHGATMASEEFGEGSEEKRPTVQVGDPFAEKRLMEASLEIMQKKLVVGIQDMGAAGITCSTFEMSARGSSGMEVNLDHVPLRDATLDAYEIFLSESQERMLLVAEPKHVEAILDIAKKWDIDCAAIGKVTTQERVVAHYKGEKVVDLPVAPVTDQAPLYERPWTSSTIYQKTLPAQSISLKLDRDLLLKFISLPNVCSRKPVFSQYDFMVGTDTVFVPGSDAAVMRIKGRNLGLAFTVDSQPYNCHANPYEGSLHVIAEGVRNLACTGAKAVAMTNCLNFGSPEIPEIMGQFKEVVRGLSDACTFFKTPVTGGNVSLYNQTGDQAIHPSPTIGLVGLIDDLSQRVPSHFQNEGDIILLVGDEANTDIYQSEFARMILNEKNLKCPPIDLQKELHLQEALLALAKAGQINSAHDCSLGGLVSALVESCENNRGAHVEWPSEQNVWTFLFGEYAGRVVVTCSPDKLEVVKKTLMAHSLTFIKIGHTQGTTLKLGQTVELSLNEMKLAREKFLTEL